MEWDPEVLALRQALESCFLDDIRASIEPPTRLSPDEAEARLLRMARGGDGPSLSGVIQGTPSLERVRELFIHRSAYQLKEADPHTWAMPQAARRGQGGHRRDPGRRVRGRCDHRDARRAVRRDDARGRSRPGLRRLPRPDPRRDPGHDQPDLTPRTAPQVARRAPRSPGAVRDDLGAEPTLRHGPAAARLRRGRLPVLRRARRGGRGARSVAAVDLAGGLAAQDPRLGADILWGAKALLAIDGRWARHMLQAWGDDSSSLRPELALR